VRTQLKRIPVEGPSMISLSSRRNLPQDLYSLKERTTTTRKRDGKGKKIIEMEDD
jgi:hypothetical protein